MSAVDLDGVMRGLKSFQRDAVMHVVQKFYGSEHAKHSGRFLIADETGLGKSVVARGVVAHTIRELEEDSSVDQINIIYICSNRDVADQNLKRLNVTGHTEIAMSTRLSLLAKTSSRLREQTEQGTDGKKPINLVSFTPGTSFSMRTHARGSGQERALLVLLLDQILQHDSRQQAAMRVLLRGDVGSVARFSQEYVGRLRDELEGYLDPNIRDEFSRLIDQEGLVHDLITLRDLMSGEDVPSELQDPVRVLISRLRRCLSRASVGVLDPHLVILDEFQRFKALLDPESNDPGAELANALFSQERAKVLLLSATPYKPFTQADEDGDEDHYEDFLATVKFLSGNDDDRVVEVQKALRDYRNALHQHSDAVEPARRASEILTNFMTRSERPSVLEGTDQLEVRRLTVPVPPSRDLSDWVLLSDLSTKVGSQLNLEYWKSVPYFVNYMDEYHIGKKLSDVAGNDRVAVTKLLKRSSSFSKEGVQLREHIAPGNSQLAELARETLDQNWWKLLWLPPSMPYLQPGPVYAQFAERSVTKHVVFSSWNATPTAIASLMSHEADRRMRGIPATGHSTSEPEHATQRLRYQQLDDEGASLSTLAIFWPHPGLLSHIDQLAIARDQGGSLTAHELLALMRERLPSETQAASQAWEAFFAYPGAFQSDHTDEAFATQHDNADTGQVGLHANIETARDHAKTHTTPFAHDDLASIAAFSPGSVAYRAIDAIAGAGTTLPGKWRAAYLIADGLRALFNRPETQTLLDQLADTGEMLDLGHGGDGDAPYWKRVLAYCADGNLRAVLDEYLFQLWCETGQKDVTDEDLLSFAEQVREVLGLRPARYRAHEATLEREPISMSARFAVRYSGGARQSAEADSHVARQSVVRSAFNSPFAPFLLASTSVGQEGIDFHWWCHSVVHWNLPGNPVDFEQREGRVNRYGGLSVRKNVAERHWQDVLKSDDPCAWRAAFESAERQPTEAGAFSPWWIYPGSSRIQRMLLQYPMSRDIDKYDRLRKSLTLYRLTLGQPRQEDMVEMLQRAEVDGTTVPTIDLRPPSVR